MPESQIESTSPLGKIAGIVGLLAIALLFTGWIYRWHYFSYFQVDATSLGLPVESMSMAAFSLLFRSPGAMARFLIGLVLACSGMVASFRAIHFGLRRLNPVLKQLQQRIGLVDNQRQQLRLLASLLDELVIVLEPELRFWVYGHGIEAMSFALMAQAAGYDVTLFGQEGLQTDLSRIGPLNITLVPSFRSYICPKPDRRTAVTLFFHDHENEARLLAQFLPSDALFIGAQGSLKARQRLLSELQVQGVSAEHIEKLCPTFGLIGSCRDPRTLAVSVLAHVLSLAGPAVQAVLGAH
jgi:xanthine/CO dehydrogenase XdhC/CoxF family maturation factor